MAGFDIAHLERRIAALEANRGASLRFGKVVGIERGYARVQLADGHDMVSMPLATLHRRVLRDQDIAMPDLQEPVAVLFGGQGLEAGVVLGAVYSPAVPAPDQEEHMDYRRYEDGTELWYDRVRHKLIAKVHGDIDAETTGSVDLRAAKKLTASVQGEATVTSEASLSFKAPRISLAGKLSCTGYDGGPGEAEILGSMNIREGGLAVRDGDVSAGDVSLKGHRHTGVDTGSGTSGGPLGGA